MGGDLRDAPASKSPTFLVAALKDPIGANLDRSQIIKGWMDAQGALHKKVYDVAWRWQHGGSRERNLTNTIGSPELITTRKDPDFRPNERAFYYARVIEIPTPRWTAYDQKRFVVKAPPGTRLTITERAYTSPIWYTPPK